MPLVDATAVLQRKSLSHSRLGCLSPPVPLLHDMYVFPLVSGPPHLNVSMSLCSFLLCRFHMWVLCLCTPASIVARYLEEVHRTLAPCHS